MKITLYNYLVNTLKSNFKIKERFIDLVNKPLLIDSYYSESTTTILRYTIQEIYLFSQNIGSKILVYIFLNYFFPFFRLHSLQCHLNHHFQKDLVF